MTTATSSSRSTRGRQQKADRSSASTASSSGQSAKREQAAKQEQSSKREQSARQGQSTTVELPFVTAQFHKPDIQLPGWQEVNSAADSVRSQLPSRDQALFYGGLAAGAAFSLIEWPVAVAIGVGNALITRNVQQHDSE